MAVYVQSVTIPAGQSLSTGLDCLGSRLIRIEIPDAFNTASLSFQISSDSVTYKDLHHVQVATDTFVCYEVVVPTVKPGSVIALPSDLGALISSIRIRSGTSGTPVPQTADREFRLVLAGA